jgi:hypothetical protein
MMINYINKAIIYKKCVNLIGMVDIASRIIQFCMNVYTWLPHDSITLSWKHCSFAMKNQYRL